MPQVMTGRLEGDIVIYGSTSGAVATAIEGARLGHKVLLVSPDEHIGGVQVEGLGATDIDGQPEFSNSRSVGGIALELHKRISSHYGRRERLEHVLTYGLKEPEIWRFEAHVAERVIKDWLEEHSNINIIQASLTASSAVVIKNEQKVQALLLSNGLSIWGKVFVDASYEGDLIAAAGISTTYGRESSSIYGESLAGVRGETNYMQIDVDFDPYVVPGEPSSGLLYGISAEEYGLAGRGDKHLAAFSFRIPVTDNRDNQLPIYEPEGYNPAHYELHRRYLRAGGKLYTPNIRVPGRKTDIIGCETPLHTDLVGMNDGWANGSRKQRQQILKEATVFTKGLLYFYTSDESVPRSVRDEWRRFGYPLDEFPDNEHFPRMLYVREARRMVSDYVITQHTASRDEGEDPVADPVAIAFWPTDTHCARRILRDGKVHNEGFIFKDKHRWRPFGISYRALVPKKDEAVNVLTSTCPSSSHVGYGAVRLEHQFHALGQACANACDIAIRDSVTVQEVPYEKLKTQLLARGAKIDASVVGAPHFAD